jgi:hypothetical protein
LPSSQASTQGMTAEIAAQRKYGLTGAGGAGFADLRAGNGVPYQVKSTVHTRANGNPGRVRFEKGNFEELREGPAGVIVVVFPSVGSSSSRPLRIEKLPAAEVEATISELGGWVRAGHESFAEQKRISWRELVSV